MIAPLPEWVLLLYPNKFHFFDVFFQAYPESASNLNVVSLQVDITLYDIYGQQVDISGMSANIDIIIGR